MEKLTQSIEAEVPARFANEEWTEYMHRAFYSTRPAASDEFGDGTVSFEPLGEGSTRVTVVLEFEPKAKSEPDTDARLARAREHLHKTLEGYRTFVSQRCEETNCWTEVQAHDGD